MEDQNILKKIFEDYIHNLMKLRCKKLEIEVLMEDNEKILKKLVELLDKEKKK